MSGRKITLSIKKIKLIGGLISFTFLFFFIFAVVEGSLAAKASREVLNVSETMVSPTPFLPGNEDSGLSFGTSVQMQLTATPRPTVVYEGGAYPTSIPQVFPTMPNISPYSIPTGINPLTGLYPAFPGLLERRPIASKITLYPRYIRPQSGLSFADIVFEYYIEGGLTRFIAVFYGNNAERVGPVRSGRFFDEHIARMYQSYLVFKYADKRVYDYLKASDIRDFLVVPSNLSCPPFVIGKQDRDTYNNIFFNTYKFSECLEKKNKDDSRPNLRSSYFSSVPSVYTEPVSSIFARYSPDDYHYWRYNPLLHKYYRYQEISNTRDGKLPSYAPLIDALTGQQVSTDNIVYLFVRHSFENQYQEEDEVYHIDLLRSGKAYLFRDGIVLPAYWRRVEADQPLLLTDTKGVPLSLKPGRTFYEVFGENSTVTKKNAQWEFQFETP